MDVVWSTRSKRSQGRIFRYIAERDPVAALDVGRRILSAGNRLGDLQTGRKGRVAGTFEKSLTDINYILIYRIDRRAGADIIYIVDILHSARRYPSAPLPD